MSSVGGFQVLLLHAFQGSFFSLQRVATGENGGTILVHLDLSLELR